MGAKNGRVVNVGSSLLGTAPVDATTVEAWHHLRLSGVLT